jgi:beta-glucosidase
MAVPIGGHLLGAVPARLHRGIDRLGVPALKETDASLGVAYAMGARGDGATALPSGMAMAATWDPELLRAGGAMIGAEARAKGFNVMLAGGVNRMREPRNGRTFEYLGEDPWLAGTLAGAAVAGIQSQRVISTVKHRAQRPGDRAHVLDARIGDAAARESDLLALPAGDRARPAGRRDVRLQPHQWRSMVAATTTCSTRCSSVTGGIRAG